MTLDPDTRKVIHDLRSSLQEIHMEHTKAQSEIATSVAVLATEFRSLKEELAKNLVPRPEFVPVKLITFGMAGIILTSVIGAVIASVLR